MALHIMLKFLKRESDSEHKTRILFVVRNRALAQFIALWVAHRVEDPRERDETLGRLWMLFAPLEDGPRRTTVEDGLVCFKKQSRGGESMVFDMMVADEAHHLYSEQASRDAIATYCGEQTRLLLLCDISQSTGSGIECLAGLGIATGFDTTESTKTVLSDSLFVCVFICHPDPRASQPRYPEAEVLVLEQVVRSTKRIFMGAMVRPLCIPSSSLLSRGSLINCRFHAGLSVRRCEAGDVLSPVHGQPAQVAHLRDGGREVRVLLEVGARRDARHHA